MFLTIFIQIVARQLIKVPTSWSVETGILLFVFVVFFGIASISRERTHLRVDTIINLLPAGFQKTVNIFGSLLVIVFLLVFSVGAAKNIYANWDVEIPTIEWFKWGYGYLILLVATSINIVYLILNLVEEIREARKT